MSSPARRSSRPGRRTALAALAWLALAAHSPYGQWSTFRKSRLIVFADAQDPRSQAVAQALAARIETALPASRATWARAPGALELVKLLASHQADVILLPPALAAQARTGTERFQAVGALPLHLLAHSEGYWLVCLDEYPEAHAWQLARALGSAIAAEQALPVHPGVLAQQNGQAMPPLADHGAPHKH
jgi:hypothetical protein